MLLPSKVMPPDVTDSWPAIILSVVDLPQPEGPSRQIYLPGSKCSEKLFTAMVSPKLFETFDNTSSPRNEFDSKILLTLVRKESSLLYDGA